MAFEPSRHRVGIGLGLLLVSLLALAVASAGEQQDEAWIDELTVGQQAGIRLDVGADPFPGSWMDSLLGLGVGTDLHLFGGDVVLHAFPNVKSYGSYETVLQRGTKILLVRYEEDMEVLREICYVITVYVEGKEYLFWRNVVFAELDQDDGWSIELEWSVDPLLANLTSFDVPVGYRVYRRFIPNDVIGTVCSTSFADLVLIEEFPVELGYSSIIFADDGVRGAKDEGRPGIAAPGSVAVNKPLGNLSVGGNLGVGVSAPSGGTGDAQFAGNVGIGGALTANSAVITGDLTVGGDIDVTNLLVMNDVDILNDLFVVGNADVLDLHVDGDLDVDGDLNVGGVKFFVQDHPTDSTKEIAYAALEGPEAGTYVRGTAHLTEGEAVIELPESFALVTADEGLTVQVTLLDPCNGLYVVEKTTERIVVRELMDGTSDAQFDYLVQGIRAGYEDYDAIRQIGEQD